MSEDHRRTAHGHGNGNDNGRHDHDEFSDCDCNTIPPSELARMLREAEKQRQQEAGQSSATLGATLHASGVPQAQGEEALGTAAEKDTGRTQACDAAAGAATINDSDVEDQRQDANVLLHVAHSVGMVENPPSNKDAKELEMVDHYMYHQRHNEYPLRGAPRQLPHSKVDGQDDDDQKHVPTQLLKEDIMDANKAWISDMAARCSSVVGAIAVDGISTSMTDDNLSTQGSIQIGDRDGDGDDSSEQDSLNMCTSAVSFHPRRGTRPQREYDPEAPSADRQRPTGIDSQLVHATLVPEGADSNDRRHTNFQSAVPVSSATGNNSRRSKEDRQGMMMAFFECKRCWIWLAVLVVTAVIVTINVMAGKEASGRESSEGSNPQVFFSGSGGSNRSVDTSFNMGGMLDPCKDAAFCEHLPASTRQRIQEGPADSPQVQALQWMTQDPHLDEYPTWRQIQRYALATFYFATLGPQWTVSNHWLSYDVSECSWTTKMDFESLVNITADQAVQGMVQRFRDSGVHAGGIHWQDLIPHASGHHHRRQLQEGHQHHHHETPMLAATGRHHDFPNHTAAETHEGGSLVHPANHVTMDAVHHENLEGASEHHHHVSEEDHVHLQNYCDENGVYRRLWPYHNHLQGTLPPELFLLSKLQVLGLCSNPELGGRLNTELGLLSDLQFFFADFNSFTGRIPSEIGLLSSLRLLSMDIQPLITGSLPSELGKLTNLFYMSLSKYDNLRGVLPSTLGQLSDSLQVLDFTSTCLTGSLPSELGSLSRLQILRVTSNPVTGTIPVEYGSLGAGQLKLLNLRLNSLTGTIPPSLSKLSSMFYLALCDNALEGTIPRELYSGLSRLGELHLDSNLLTGTIATEIGLLGNSLRTLIVSETALTGTLPLELSRLHYLEYLNIRSTNIQGTLSHSFVSGWTPNLKGLAFSDTLITGTIPSDFCALSGFLDFTCSSQLCGCYCVCLI
ncbi:LRR receptor-like serine threonine-protein kinase [Seminavis robusta]|uniref:LRR receptor-like serine threonine-protein kinase n=1 Tax=Seminavis robusta TaxID=568900 RepID=A0A9N8DVQ9_9STRA|nr:LRR receptor-like serine threonine-protein kinase [Seminavis robusta]|eukprot:Sro318_g115910.1 LRR receptor-like serine threonine-protein kinase (961) ;mRNA; r:28678-31754